MPETYEMPDWVQVGADVISVHYYSSAAAGYPWSEGSKWKVVRVLKTQVEVEREWMASENRVTTVRRKFRLGRNGLYEMGDKYNPDTLHPEGGKMVLSIRAFKAKEAAQRQLRAQAKIFAERAWSWLDSKEAEDFARHIAQLAVELVEAEARVEAVQRMGKGDIIVAK